MIKYNKCYLIILQIKLITFTYYIPHTIIYDTLTRHMIYYI